MQSLKSRTSSPACMHTLHRAPLATARCRPAQQHRHARCNASYDFRRLFLPDGAWFLDTSMDSDAPIYGESFVMHSPSHASQQARRPGVQGLVPLRKPTGVAVRQPQPSDIVPLAFEDIEVSIVVLPVEEREETGIVPFKQMLQDADSSSSQGRNASSNCLAIVPKDSTMLGMVMSSAVRRRDDDLQLPVNNNDTVYETFNTKHKRRTMKIKFKCQRCGATTIKPVNPHAWTSGTVFAKCGCCNITHKLIDNLKLFHELAGPVFNTPIMPATSSSSSSSDSSSSGTGTANGQDGGSSEQQEQQQGLEIKYDSNGFPVLPDRLQLRLKPWQVPQDFPDDISNFN